MRSLLLPSKDLSLVRGEVTAILEDVHTGVKRIYKTRNIITDAGDIYYAQLGAGEATTNSFDTLELGTAGTPGKAADRSDFTPIASTQKLVTATYPQTNDGDGDNTGAGVDIVTWQFQYTAGDFNNAAITHGWITNDTPGASEPLLTGFAFTG